MKHTRALTTPAWIARNSLSLTIFIVPFVFTVAVGVAFLTTYWGNFDYYGTRIIDRLVEETKQLEPQLSEHFERSGFCTPGAKKLQLPSNITSIGYPDCSTFTSGESFHIEQCVNSMPGSAFMRWHCDSLVRKVGRHNADAFSSGQPERTVGLTAAGLQYIYSYRADARVSATRSYVSIFENWQNYAGAQFKAFIFPFSALIAVSVLLYFLVIRRISILSREARRSVKERRADSFGDPHSRKDEIGTLARYLRVLLRQSARQTQRLRVTNAELEKQNESLRRVRKMIGHDIYSPLQFLHGVVAGNTRALAQVNRIARATDAILSEGTISSNAVPIDIADFIKSWIRNVASERRLSCLEYAGPENGVQAIADVEQLEDALEHIINNALDFKRPNTSITVELCSTPEWVSIIVRNHGPLIGVDALDRIFDYGVSLREQSNGSNLGQGLYRARQFLTSMGGTIKARNLPPDQVEFVFELAANA